MATESDETTEHIIIKINLREPCSASTIRRAVRRAIGWNTGGHAKFAEGGWDNTGTTVYGLNSDKAWGDILVLATEQAGFTDDGMYSSILVMAGSWPGMKALCGVGLDFGRDENEWSPQLEYQRAIAAVDHFAAELRRKLGRKVKYNHEA